MVRARDCSPFSSGFRRGSDSMASNRLVVARGRGGEFTPGALRKKISSNRGRAFLRALPFCLAVFAISRNAVCLMRFSLGVNRLPTWLENTLMGRHRSKKSRALRSSTPWNLRLNHWNCRRSPPREPDPDAARRPERLCPATGGHTFARAVAARSRELDDRRLRLHSEALRFDAAGDRLSRWGEGAKVWTFVTLFAVARQS